jgi:hypothetical protein
LSVSFFFFLRLTGASSSASAAALAAFLVSLTGSAGQQEDVGKAIEAQLQKGLTAFILGVGSGLLSLVIAAFLLLAARLDLVLRDGLALLCEGNV